MGAKQQPIRLQGQLQAIAGVQPQQLAYPGGITSWALEESVSGASMAPLRTSYKSKPFELLRRGEHHWPSGSRFRLRF